MNQQVSSEPTLILDHGFVRYIEHWGSDERIIEAARESTDKGFRSWLPYYECQECKEWWLDTENPKTCQHSAQDWVKLPRGDFGLLSHLHKKKHTTPFEMGGCIFQIQAPIFVFREWHRHRTQSYNEMSARYTPLPNVNYIPSVERLLMNSGGKNKQAGTVRGSEVLTEVAAMQFRDKLALEYLADEKQYQWALSVGVPKELARVHLPVGRYSRMRASAVLLNWLRFLTLRMAPDAQWEIRMFADVVCSILKGLFPRTMELFLEGREKG